jgi:hypothetical protein
MNLYHGKRIAFAILLECPPQIMLLFVANARYDTLEGVCRCTTVRNVGASAYLTICMIYLCQCSAEGRGYHSSADKKVS